ncbi:hypothetical protein GUJ93_ZPchr0008g11536 [Zizania palustris]|uniref:Uncharacterized protein n=1 Tax=Zizania palustris TaxID=103762 RepID=A0A8J5RF22_ZIZPA|nr:hypothetical protein GUJ93_ZPchr0008g11536 [Zizania palustris]
MKRAPSEEEVAGSGQPAAWGTGAGAGGFWPASSACFSRSGISRAGVEPGGACACACDRRRECGSRRRRKEEVGRGRRRTEGVG